MSRSASVIDAVLHFLSCLRDPEQLGRLLTDAGPWVLVLMAAIVFAESGLLVGFFLPGDSLLIVAGVVSAKGGFSFWSGALVIALAAVVGDQVGFRLGRVAGKAVFSKPDGRFIKRKHFAEAHDYYVRNGARAIVVARFIPVLRTFVPFMAGVAEMPYRKFVFWNIAGGVLWVFSVLGAGYLLGNRVEVRDLDRIILGVVAVSLIPVVWGVAKRFLKSRER